MYEQFYPVISCSEDTCGYIDHLTSGLFVASSFAGSVMNSYTTIKVIPTPHVPANMTAIAADWGGYRIVKDWQGIPPFTPEQYIEWLETFEPQWAATWDYPCGDEFAQQDSKVVEKRQDKSTLMAWYFWTHYQDRAWTWTPTVQGVTVEDYQRHAQDLYPLIRKMAAFYRERDGEHTMFRVGIGSLVRRNAPATKAIFDAVAAILPEDVMFHGWGIKKSVLNSSFTFKRLRSSDSAAYNNRFGTDLEQYKGLKKPQRQTVFEDVLPAYQEAIYAATAQPYKQEKTLFDVLNEEATA